MATSKRRSLLSLGIGENRHKADRVVAETNNGGDMVEAVIRHVDPNVSFKAVHASRGKLVRAEPIAALYEQGRVHHVGVFAQLEDQLCTYDPASASASPDRMDAAVWGLTELSEGTGSAFLRWLENDREKRQQEAERAEATRGGMVPTAPVGQPFRFSDPYGVLRRPN